MAFEWTVLDPVESQDFDTPALTKSRNAVNAEIAEILAERQRIDTAVATLENTPVESLTIEQMSAAREAKADTFRLLQRELALRKNLLPACIKESQGVAYAASDKVQASIPDVEAGVIKDLEKIGYRKFQEHDKSPGSWTTAMVAGHPKVVDAKKRYEHLLGHSSNYGEGRLNAECIEKLTASLTSVRNQLVT